VKGGRAGPRRVFFHIGLPKTGTTYLQTVLWEGARRLRRDGVLLPGKGHREHLWAALDLQGRRLDRRDARAAGAWQRLAAEAFAHDETVLFTHEFFCTASKKQAARAIGTFPDSEVHLVVTARDAGSMLLSGWQEAVKNGSSVTLDELREGGRGGGVEFSWRAWGLRQVLARWAGGLPPERVHVLPVPDRSLGPRRLWENFAGVLGVDPDAFSPPEQPVNTTLGAVQAELLRRLNGGIEGFSSPVDRGVWIRGYLAEQMLSAQEGERLALTDEQFEDCERRSLRAIDLIQARGYDVVGTLDTLRPRPQTKVGRRLDTVTEDELMRAAGGLVGMMLTDIRNRV
jgi:hypothetical protein